MDPSHLNRNIQPHPNPQINFNPPKYLSFIPHIAPLPIQKPVVVSNFFMKEDVYVKKFEEINNEIKMLQNGVHDEYNGKCKLFLEEKEKKIESAEKFKKLQIASIENSFQQMKEQTENDFNVKKILLPSE
jgi:hypothetical protein